MLSEYLPFRGSRTWNFTCWAGSSSSGGLGLVSVLTQITVALKEKKTHLNDLIYPISLLLKRLSFHANYGHCPLSELYFGCKELSRSARQSTHIAKCKSSFINGVKGKAIFREIIIRSGKLTFTVASFGMGLKQVVFWTFKLGSEPCVPNF